MDRREFAGLATAGLAIAGLAGNAAAARRSPLGTFRATGSGSAQTGRKRVGDSGSAAGLLWSVSSVAESLLTFRRNGTGTSEVRRTSLLGAVYVPADDLQDSPANLQHPVEIATFRYDFDYEIWQGRIAIIVRPGTWKGRIVEGPRAKREYEVEANYDDHERPLLEGYFSADAGQLVLNSPEPVLSRQTDKLGTFFSRQIMSVNGFAVG